MFDMTNGISLSLTCMHEVSSLLLILLPLLRRLMVEVNLKGTCIEFDEAERDIVRIILVLRIR